MNDKLIVTSYARAAINFETMTTTKGKEVVRLNTTDTTKPFTVVTAHSSGFLANGESIWNVDHQFLNDGGFWRESEGEMKITRSANKPEDFTIDFIPNDAKSSEYDAVFNVVSIPISGNVVGLDAASENEKDLDIIRAFTVKCNPFELKCQKHANRRKSYVDWKFDRLLILFIKADPNDPLAEIAVATNNVGKNKDTGKLTLTNREFIFDLDEYKKWIDNNDDRSAVPTSGDIFRISFRGHEEVEEKPESFSVRKLTKPVEYKPFNGSRKAAPVKEAKKPFGNAIRMKGDNKDNGAKKSQKKKRK